MSKNISKMSNDSYLTIKEASEGVYKEKGSKFLAFAYPCENEIQFKEYLDMLKNKYHDAQHYCYAYSLGFPDLHTRANDDGEPRHSAGTPILGQIKSRNLTNTLVIVIRYFGGTKLGVSGLINAYKSAASEALSQGEIIDKYLSFSLQIQFNYEKMNEVMQLIKKYDLDILEQKMELDVEMMLDIRQRDWEQMMDNIQKIDSLKVLNS